MYSVYSSLDCPLDGQSQDQEAKYMYIIYIIRIRKYFLCKSLCFLFKFYHSLCDCVLFTGKILIIGGGIANFTNVSATFKVNFIHLLLFKNPVKKRPQIAFNIANRDLS